MITRYSGSNHFFRLIKEFYRLVTYTGNGGNCGYKIWIPYIFKKEDFNQTRASGEVEIRLIKRIKFVIFHMQTEVSLSATKVTTDPDIVSMTPTKRNCYFDHEHPRNKPLKIYQKYTQVSYKAWMWITFSLRYTIFEQIGFMHPWVPCRESHFNYERGEQVHSLVFSSSQWWWETLYPLWNPKVQEQDWIDKWWWVFGKCK